MIVGLTLGLEGEPPKGATTGLGFARAFATAERVELVCAALLPDDGVSWGGATPANDAIWARAAVVARALAVLNARDGSDRRVPGSVTERDVAIAQIVVELLSTGEIRHELDGEFDVPLPEQHDAGIDLPQLLSVEVPLPPLCGGPTNLTVVQTIERASPLAIVDGLAGRKRLRCRADDAGGAAIVLRLA